MPDPPASHDSERVRLELDILASELGDEPALPRAPAEASPAEAPDGTAAPELPPPPPPPPLE